LNTAFNRRSEGAGALIQIKKSFGADEHLQHACLLLMDIKDGSAGLSNVKT
jgi:hypothetical protein